MSWHPLDRGERFDRGAQRREPVCREPLDGDRLEERLEPEAAHGARPSSRRKDVVAAGRVVARRDRRPLADEDRADPREARLTGYETMSAVSSGTGPFPTAAQVDGGAFLAKSISADAVARPWIFFGDEKIFYLAIDYHPSYGHQTYFFGEPVGFRTPDPYNTVLGASSGSVAVYSGYFYGSIDRIGNGQSPAGFSGGDNIVPRAPNGLGTARSSGRTTACGFGAGESGTNPAVQYPNPADNALVFADILMLSDQSLRARYPGVYWVPQQLNGAFAARDIVVGSGAFSGKTFVAVPSSSSTNYGGAYFVDRDGPWR